SPHRRQQERGVIGVGAGCERKRRSVLAIDKRDRSRIALCDLSKRRTAPKEGEIEKMAEKDSKESTMQDRLQRVFDRFGSPIMEPTTNRIRFFITKIETKPEQLLPDPEQLLPDPEQLLPEFIQPSVAHVFHIPRLPPKALQQLASDFLTGEIYTSAHIRQETDSLDAYKEKLNQVFSRLSSVLFLNSIGLIYEYKDKATGNLADGTPTFDSLCVVCKEDLPAFSKAVSNAAASVVASV